MRRWRSTSVRRHSIKINVYMSDDGWEGLKQMAYDKGYVRGSSPGDRPRGISHFISMLSMLKWRDARPDVMQGTGQWMTGLQRARQRCLQLPLATIGDLGLIALEHGIYPYRSQIPVVNGYRREGVLPVLHGVGDTPRGGTSVAGLAGPVLDAIGLGHLRPAGTVPQAPPNLFQGPSTRYAARSWRAGWRRSVM